MINEDGLVHKNRFMLFPWISLRQSGLYLFSIRFDNQFSIYFPNFGGKGFSK